MKHFIGIDIGTYETKGTLADIDGKVIKTAKRRHSIIIPQNSKHYYPILQIIKRGQNVT